MEEHNNQSFNIQARKGMNFEQDALAIRKAHHEADRDLSHINIED